MIGGILGGRWKGLGIGGGGELGLGGELLGGDLYRLRGVGWSGMGQRGRESMYRENGHHEAFHLHRTWNQLILKVAWERDYLPVRTRLPPRRSGISLSPNHSLTHTPFAPLNHLA